MGTAISGRRGRRRGSVLGSRQSVSIGSGRDLPRATPRHVQALVQRRILWWGKAGDSALKRDSYFIVSHHTEWDGNQDNRGAAGISRPARFRIRLVARPSGPVSKVIWWSATLAKKFFSPSANSSNLGRPIRSPGRF